MIFLSVLKGYFIRFVKVFFSGFYGSIMYLVYFDIFVMFSLLFRFMRQMNTEKLFDEGNYMVIYLYPETVKVDERQFFLWNLEEMSTATVNANSRLAENPGMWESRIPARCVIYRQFW